MEVGGGGGGGRSICCPGSWVPPLSLLLDCLRFRRACAMCGTVHLYRALSEKSRTFVSWHFVLAISACFWKVGRDEMCLFLEATETYERPLIR